MSEEDRKAFEQWAREAWESDLPWNAWQAALAWERARKPQRLQQHLDAIEVSTQSIIATIESAKAEPEPTGRELGMTDNLPVFDGDTAERYIQILMAKPNEMSDREKTLVYGNIRGFWQSLHQRGGIVPLSPSQTEGGDAQ